MYKIKLTNYYDNKPLIMYFTDGLCITNDDNNERGSNKKFYTRVSDSRHNNGGWKVTESLEEVEAIIDEAIKAGK